MLWVIVVLGVFICVVRPLVGGSSHVPYFRLQLLAQVEQERHCKLTDHHRMESLSGECLRHVVDRGAITPVPLWWCPGPATAQFSAASLHNCVSVEHAVFFSLLGSKENFSLLCRLVALKPLDRTTSSSDPCVPGAITIVRVLNV